MALYDIHCFWHWVASFSANSDKSVDTLPSLLCSLNTTKLYSISNLKIWSLLHPIHQPDMRKDMNLRTYFADSFWQNFWHFRVVEQRNPQIYQNINRQPAKGQEKYYLCIKSKLLLPFDVYTVSFIHCDDVDILSISNLVRRHFWSFLMSVINLQVTPDFI